jgi:ABC-type uncharacterized transport system substrate-binding protein
MKRRDFIMNVGGTALAWPFLGLAQPSDRTRRIGVPMSTAESDPEGRSRITAFTQVLQTLGWTDGRNIPINVRWDAGDAKRAQMHAAELLTLAPDLLVANAAPALLAVQRETSTIPILFVQVADPIGGGFVTNLAHPSGNVTGFTSESSGGVIAMPDPLFTINRDKIIALASRHRLPAMYYFRVFATSGGLMSYGPDTTDIYQRAASYVDRILKGAQPKDLPVQQPTKFELVINLKTAKALALTIPQSLTLRAIEVIQ